MASLPSFSMKMRVYWTASIFMVLLMSLEADAFPGIASRSSCRHTHRLSSPKNLRRKSPRLFAFSPDDGTNDDASFMQSLRERVDQVQDRDSQVPIVVLDTMLPRQVLKLETNNEIFLALMKHLVQTESNRFGMVGTSTLKSTGQVLPLQNGVEVFVTEPPIVAADDFGVRVTLQAGRRIRILEQQVVNAPQGWGEARVQFLSSDEEEQEEAYHDPLSLDRAVQMANELTLPSSMYNGMTLIDRWLELARQQPQTQPGQIDQLLEDLGPIPPPDQPSERAFWTGALINPLPGLGVAMEIRPQLLMARTAETRVQVALQGLMASIGHMDGSQPLF